MSMDQVCQRAGAAGSIQQTVEAHVPAYARSEVTPVDVTESSNQGIAALLPNGSIRIAAPVIESSFTSSLVHSVASPEQLKSVLIAKPDECTVVLVNGKYSLPP